MVFCDLVNNYIDGDAEAISIPAYLNKYHIFTYNKASKLTTRVFYITKKIFITFI